MQQPSHASPRWDRIAPYLDRALDLEPHEREAWLAELTQTRPEIAQKVRGLLARHVVLDAQGFLERSAIDPPAPTAHSGMQIGAYTVERPIGRGGMGEVWLAVRSDGRYQGQCAIKFLSNTAPKGGLAERFQREGQLLGRLAHPNIARLLDAGATADGRPYLALEYVEGISIDRYCDSKSLDVKARLRLFMDVLAAVTHAQEHLVVHRDLKPSNVLVTHDGIVKLLDFGVAKLMEDANLPGFVMITREGAFALTPAYAAPEQLTNAPITMATDVYALGVLLYVLLSGVHPTGAQASSPAEIVYGILHVDPSPLTQAVPGINGELQTILGKALKKSPQERYGSAAAFADDLRCYLTHRPISARPDTLLYRARKFVRRNRVSVAAGVLLLVGLTASLLAVNRERVIAERRFDQLRALSAKVFELDKAIVGLPESTLARQRLVTASLQYLEGLAKDVHGDLDLMLALGDGYWRIAHIQGVPTDANLGEYDEAERNLAIAERYVDAVYAATPDDRNVEFLAVNIAHDRMILADEGRRRDEALAHARKAAVLVDRFLSAGLADQKAFTDVLLCSGNVALAFINMSQYEEAIRMLRRVLELDRIAGGPGANYRRSVALSLLANALRLQGNLPEAVRTIREARAIAERTTYTSAITRMAHRYGILLREGMILRELKELDPAAAVDPTVPFQKAVEVTEEFAARDPRDSSSRGRLATASRELGELLKERDPERALAVYDNALQRLDETPNTIKARRTRAELLAKSTYPLRRLDRGTEAGQRLDAALAILAEAKDLPAEGIALDGPQFAVLSARADAAAATGRIEEAAVAYAEILSKAKYDTPWAAPEKDLRSAQRLARLLRTLTSLYVQAGDETKAEEVRARQQELARVWQARLPGNLLVNALAKTAETRESAARDDHVSAETPRGRLIR
jgi:serine/threonine protein kinase/tetratricopeptide (TPR) repeat protein